MVLNNEYFRKDAPRILNKIRRRTEELAGPNLCWDEQVKCAEEFHRLVEEPNISPLKKKALAEKLRSLESFGSFWDDFVMRVGAWSENDEIEK